MTLPTPTSRQEIPPPAGNSRRDPPTKPLDQVDTTERLYTSRLRAATMEPLKRNRRPASGVWRLAWVLTLLVVGPLAPTAQAQSFGPPVPGRLLLVLLDKEGNVRFTLGSYYASWENPFRVRLTTFSPALGQVVSRRISIVGDTPASPLFEGTYVLSPRWSIGFWYNPIRGERLRKTVQIADSIAVVNLERDVDLVDLHAIYYGPRGLSAQVGYYREQGTIFDRNSTVGLQSKYKLQSLNLWLTQRLDVRWRKRLITPFVLVGYHTASEMERPLSLMYGFGVTFNERLSLSGSLWRFDLSRPATRITMGLVYRFQD
jgi:hypothetical protein